MTCDGIPCSPICDSPEVVRTPSHFPTLLKGRKKRMKRCDYVLLNPTLSIHPSRKSTRYALIGPFKLVIYQSLIQLHTQPLLQLLYRLSAHLVGRESSKPPVGVSRPLFVCSHYQKIWILICTRTCRRDSSTAARLHRLHLSCLTNVEVRRLPSTPINV